jgi:hypothetical protein
LSERYHYKKDIKAVATAVQQLIDSKTPAGTAPGPVGDGYIGCHFFAVCLSALEHPIGGHLQAQINKVCFPLAFGASQ